MRVTMSKVGALTLCQWWARPDAQWTWTPPGPAAEFGNAVHAEIAAAIKSFGSGAAPAAHRDAAIRDTAGAVVEWWHHARDDHALWHAEPAYVLDLAGSARHVGNDIGRKYPRTGDGEIAGSADIVGISDGVASVYDIKTGRRENVDAAEENAQLATLALAVHLAHGVDTVRVGLVFPTPGGVVTDEHTLDALDLAAWHGELVALTERIPTSEPQPSKKACQYCPAKAACPAMSEALAAAAPKTRLPVVMSARDIQSPEHAAEQYRQLRAAKTAIDAAWSALRQYVDEHGPVDLGDGRAYGSKQTKRESLDLSTRAAVEALRAQLGPAWELAVSLETSKTAIKDAAREAAKQTGESVAAVERRTVDALRAVGAVKQSTSTTYDEIEAKEHAA